MTLQWNSRIHLTFSGIIVSIVLCNPLFTRVAYAGDGGPDKPAQVTRSFLKTIRTVLTKSLDKEFKKERQRRRRGHAHERSGLSAAVVPYEFSRRVNCSSSGTATVTGTVTPRQIPRGADSSGIVVFENCNGVDGTTNFTGSSTYANNKYASEKHVDGGVTFVCSGVIPGSAALHLAFQTSVTSTGAGVTFSGDFSASCGAVPLVSCAWSKIALPDPAAVQAGCQK